MFIAALFTIAKTWRQPKRLLTDELIKKMWHAHTHTHNGILVTKKKKRKNVICRNMGGSRDYHTK